MEEKIQLPRGWFDFDRHSNNKKIKNPEYWPFSRISRQDLLELPPLELARAEGMLEAVILRYRETIQNQPG